MVNFTCSDSTLQHAFEWAKATALSYVREDTIVGLWYEAALPGRDAFCMRDVSHQGRKLGFTDCKLLDYTSGKAEWVDF
ncbi:MAG: hypothetical protein ABFS05_14090 [Bacteroidota bacterium]